MIVYSLVPPEKGGLVLALSVQGESCKRVLYRAFLQGFTKQKEELELLMQEELAFRGVPMGSGQVETTPFNLIHVRSKRVFHVLRALGGGSGLFLKGKRVAMGEVLPFKMAVKKGEGEVEVEGFLKDRSLDSVEWLLPCEEAWCVVDGKLCPIEGGGISLWQWVFPKGQRLSGFKRERFLEAVEGADFCSVSLEERVERAHPVLVLTDERGAFARLKIEYGEKRVDVGDGGRGEPWRRPDEERGFERDLIEAGYLPKVMDEARYYCSLDKVAGTLQFLLELGWKVEKKGGEALVLMEECFATYRREGDAIVVEGAAAFGSKRASLCHLLQAAKKGQSLLPLVGGGVGLIDPAGVQRTWGALMGFSVPGKEIRLPRSHVGLILELPGVPQELQVKEAAWQEVEPGRGFVGKLHPYQRLGLNWLNFLCEAGFHALLADEMGLGKTVQVLALFSRIEASHPHLILAPTSLLFNWRQECARFLPGLRVVVHSGPNRTADWGDAECVITSYATLRQDLELFRGRQFCCIVLDEAHEIRNPEAMTTKAVCALQGRMRIALSGTPLVNRYGDLWSLFHFLIPGLLEKGEFSSQSQAKVAPFFLQRKKAEVAKDLPPKLEQLVWVGMEEEQAAYYERVLHAGRQGLVEKIAADGAEAHRMEILELILRLRQICCHPRLVEKGQEMESCKLQALLLDVEEMHAEGKKVILFSQFTSMLQLIEVELKERGMDYALLHGGTQDREGVVRSFTTDPQKLVLLSSLKAGGVGLNLQVASAVLLFDPWWNEAVERQAIDRAHRLGRKEPLLVKRYLVLQSVEEKMEAIKKAKAHMSLGQVMTESARQDLTTEDLCALMELSSTPK